MTVLQKIKLALRLTDSTFDSELNDLISACIADLALCGIDGDTVITTTTDPLIIQTIVAYCKWRFGDPQTPEKWQALYELQKAQLAMATGYTSF